MINIVRTDNEIHVKGHANDKTHPRCEESVQACECVTALTQTLLHSIHKLGKDYPEYTLKYGEFKIDTTKLSNISRILVASFMVGVKLASTTYIDYITVVDNKSRRV